MEDVVADEAAEDDSVADSRCFVFSFFFPPFAGLFEAFPLLGGAGAKVANWAWIIWRPAGSAVMSASWLFMRARCAASSAFR